MRAFVCGCSGLVLSEDERAFLRETEPFGLILFKRNIDTPAQVKALADAFADCLGRDHAAILIDQEGGRVQRLGPPHWRTYPPAFRFGQTRLPLDRQAKLVRGAARIMAHDLRELGITVDCLPVLDVPVPGSHSVIGDRAYGDTPETVATLGRAAAEGLLDGHVLPVMKHVPGHGRAMADSHMELPIVTVPVEALRQSDFAPFKANADLPAAMTAHVVYEALDPERPATLSPLVVETIIRHEIGFDGLLISDDLSMRALKGSFRDRAEGLFAAGVDIALHCNGDLQEARAVAAGTPLLEGKALERADAAMARLGGKPAAGDFDPVDAWKAIEAELAITA
ncbi:beta-N-acetylhexosaminidase [Methyloferula stellata]|uniref:beta-N-acetylhexosaminidase n=1 Tax=Methyloferula stellata TaxID=876270 RepID=UPI00037B6807|nr:beta-N-acetylhexosaminidase [Methyloferula stellata]